MAIRKNKKRIDPRYFLHETTYRDLNENVEMDLNDVASAPMFNKQAKKVHSTPEDFEALQAAMGDKYYVIDAGNDTPGFIKYVQRREETPNGGEPVLELEMYETWGGQRVLYFKTADTHNYGKFTR